MQILKILVEGYGSIPCDAFSPLEKDEDLDDAITPLKATYAKKVKVAQDPMLWE